ncbi:MAG: protein translocase subunit SecF [Nitrospirae bacterium]|nr:protein translocase subunit SecF [Candidatus Manganitrophaceae bacterium]
MFTIIKKTDIDFIGKRKQFFMISLIFVAIGLIALVQISRGSGNLGIDFSGGAALQLKFDQPIEINAARKALESGGLKNATLQEISSDNKLIIRLKKREISGENIRGKVKDIFSTAFSGNNFIVESSTEIGPTIGKKLQGDAINAIIFSLVLIITYIAFRFEFRFGIAAAIATFHDVFVVLGFFFLMDKEISLLLVTALLTVAGYSLNDTVVVFDRIRENLKSRKKETFGEVINRSINDNLSRTVITSMTTFLAVVALFLFGGEVIHDFALAVLLGVVVGTYSSWFIASSLLVTWQQKRIEIKTKKRVLKKAS